MTGTSEEFFRGQRSLETVRGQITSEAGLCRDIIVSFLDGVPGINDGTNNSPTSKHPATMRGLSAALQLLIDHCDIVGVDGPADSARRQNCQAILQKLRSARG
jgi:hypothetical protein